MIKTTDETSDYDIINLCIQGDGCAWRSLFERYNDFIDHQIVRTFHLDYYPYTEEDFEQVKDNIIDILLAPGNLKKIDTPNRFKQWLARVSRNKTHDFVRAKKAIKNSVEEEAGKSSLSLQNPVGAEGDCTLEEMIGGGNPYADRPTDDIAEKTREFISSVEWIYQIPLKLYLIFCDDLLVSEDIRKIARERDVTLTIVKQGINSMLENLVKKHEKNICLEGEIRVTASYLNRLKARLDFLNQAGTGNNESINNIKLNIQQRESRLADLIQKNPKPVVPSNREIGEVLGVKEETVATRLFRVKKMIRERWNRDKDNQEQSCKGT